MNLSTDTTSTAINNSKKYFDYLDALRCLAFLAVFYAHTGSIFAGANVSSEFPLDIWSRFTVYGSYGVNFFFVLSGFLITYLLLKEREESPQKTISIRQFYKKRVLRIWPVYFMTLFVGAFVLPYIISSATYDIFTLANPNMSVRTFLYNFFFSGNIYQGMQLGMAPLSIGILWSVCVEEQFYFIWPWIVKYTNVRSLAFLTSFLISLSLLYKFLWADDRMANYYLPWSVGMDIGFGALFGISYFAKRTDRIVRTAIIMIGSSVALVLAVSTLSMKSETVEILRLTKTLVIDAIFILIILFFVNRTRGTKDAPGAESASSPKNLTGAKGPVESIGSKAKFLETPYIVYSHISNRAHKILTHLGKISYGLYAYHTICLMITVHVLRSIGILNRDVNRSMFFLTIIIAFVVTIIVAELSYFYIEKKFLALKDTK